MTFLGIVFTNFIYEKLLSHEALVAARVTATRNDQTQLFKKASFIEKSCYVGSSDSQLRAI